MAQIVDMYGRPLKSETLKTTQSVKLSERLRIYPDHPSRGLNIRRLPRILEAAEQGNLSAQACLFGDMEERDGHLFAEMEKRRNALLTLDWSIEPPVNASRDELNLTAAVADWMTGIPNMEDVILNGMSAVGYGFSCQEIVWELVDKTWLPASLTKKPHHWFITTPEHGDEIRLDDGSYEDGKSGSGLWPFGWLVHRNNARSGFIGSSGLYRVLVWPYLFKNFALRDLAEFLEIYGLPARIAYYAQGTSDEDRDQILEALVTLGHEAVAAIPQGNEIKFENAASGGADTFMAMIDWAERTTSKAILGSTLTSQADGKTSTNALGNVHNEVRHDILTADARQLEGMFNNLAHMLATLNGYDEIHPRRLPRFVFDTQEEIDISNWATGLATLVNQVRLSDIPVSWVRKKTGIPTPKDGEPVLEVPPVATLTAPVSLRQRYESLNLAALNTRTTDDDDPAQEAIDRAELPADAINQGMQELLAPLVQALQQGQSADEAMNILAEAWPTLPDDTLRQLLTQAFFVSDIWGRLNADS
jgi:phage gp29-like protein